MIILDTNVVSAAMRPDRNAIVVRWLDAQPIESLWITTISILEIRFGLQRLPAGRKRLDYERSFETYVDQDLAGRVLPFERSAAEEAGKLAAARRNVGRTVDFRDIQIAGIALARRATLATRNIRDFSDAGLNVINPWEAAPSN